MGRIRIISFASGKGGVGKTNISINLAIALSDIVGNEPVILDADLGMANVNILLGIPVKYSLLDLITKKKKISDILIKTEYGVQFIPGLSALYQKMDNMENLDKEYFFQELGKLSDVDTLFVDLGAGLLNNVMNFVLSSDELILIITSEPTSITDAYSLMKTIVGKKDKFKIKFILNRMKNRDEAVRISERLKRVSKDFLNIDIEYLGILLEDENVKKAVIKQKPFYRLYPKTKASKCIYDIASKLLLKKNQNMLLDKKSNSRLFNFFSQFIRK